MGELLRHGKWPAIWGFVTFLGSWLVRGAIEEWIFSSLTSELEKNAWVIGDFLAWDWAPLLLGAVIFGGLLAVSIVMDRRKPAQEVGLHGDLRTRKIEKPPYMEKQKPTTEQRKYWVSYHAGKPYRIHAVAGHCEPAIEDNHGFGDDYEGFIGQGFTPCPRCLGGDKFGIPGIVQHPPTPLTAECQTESGIILGDDRTCLAYLVIGNNSQRDIRNAYACVKLIEHEMMMHNGEERHYRRRLYRQHDVFLKWDASDTRHHTFRTEAKLRVAVGRKGDGHYRLDSVEPPSLFPSLHLFAVYQLHLEIAADDTPTFRKAFFLRMEEASYRSGGRTILLDAPYPVEFREWKDTDAIESEFDIDEWRASSEQPGPDTGESEPR